MTSPAHPEDPSPTRPEPRPAETGAARIPAAGPARTTPRHAAPLPDASPGASDEASAVRAATDSGRGASATAGPAAGSAPDAAPPAAHPATTAATASAGRTTTLPPTRQPARREAALEAVDLRKSYGRGGNRFDAVKGVSLKVSRGESLAVVGKSGSGKSTLMHMLALLDEPTSGSIRVAGRDATSLPSRELNRLRNQEFGFVFQQFFLTPGASVLENVVLPLTIAGFPRRVRRARGMQALEQLDLADKARNRATDLSGGQKQRVVIARALVNNPRVIFADEPTGNLDSATGETVEDILFSLNREQGITLVVVTHDDELASRCDRSVQVRDGLVVSEHEGVAA